MAALRFVSSRLLQAAITLVITSMIVFLLARASGSPVDLYLPLDATEAQRVALTKEMGLDKPLYEQYATLASRMVRGDFGVSVRFDQPVWEVVRPGLLYSTKLALVAIGMAIIFGIPIGVCGAVYRNRTLGRVAMGFATLGQSLPAFAVGVSLMLVFSVYLGWLPVAGAGDWTHYVLPGSTLGWFVMASVARLLRSELLNVETAEFIKFARAKGVSQRGVIWTHMVRNSLSPVITLLGFSAGLVLAASVTTEVLFSWPGVGNLAYQAVVWRDFPLLEFLVIIFAAIMIITNLTAEMLQFFLDPRLRK